MLDFDLERAKERLSVSSNVCPPSPRYAVICSSSGQLWLRERADSEPTQNISHMDTWQARILQCQGWRLCMCLCGVEVVVVKMIVVAYHPTICIFIYLTAILLKNAFKFICNPHLRIYCCISLF